MIVTEANIVIDNLYWDKTIKNGKTVIKLAKEAPAPIAINNEGKILKRHMKECVKEALNDEKGFDNKVEEILKTLKR